MREGQDTSFEGNLGLCGLAADIMIDWHSQLRPDRHDIIEDLKFRLWKIVEDGGYNRSKANFSTYAMAGLLREYRVIMRLYRGIYVRDRWISNRPIPLSLDGFGFSIDRISGCSSYDGDYARKEDARVLLKACFDSMQPRDARFLEHRIRGSRCTVASDAAGGFVKTQKSEFYIAQRAHRAIESAAEQNPKLRNMIDSYLEESA